MSRLLLAVVLCGPAFAQGIIQTFAGTDWVFPGDGKPAVDAPLGPVARVVVDASGNVYFTDTGNDMVMKVDPAGVLTVAAGNGLPGFSGDGGPAPAASMRGPLGLAVDGAGHLYIADTGNGRIRLVTPAGIISTVVASVSVGDGVAVDTAGSICFSHRGTHRVRKVAPNGVITDVAGTGVAGFSGDNGPADRAQLHAPGGISFDLAGNLYIADINNCRVRRVSTEGLISTVAGNGMCDFRGDGGPATGAAVRPIDVRPDAAGVLYIADFPQRIRRVGLDGRISTVAGSGMIGFSGDGGPALRAAMSRPEGVAVDGTGAIYVAEVTNQRIRRVAPDGIITTLAGNGAFRRSPDGIPATSSFLFRPSGVAVDRNGVVHFGDLNFRVFKVTPEGRLVTVAGDGTTTAVPDGAPATSGGLGGESEHITFDAENHLYVALGGRRVRRVTPEGIISTVAAAPSSVPLGVALDGAGNLYFSERDTNLVWKRTPQGAVTIFAGTGQAGFSGDNGPATSAMLNAPHGVAVDLGGNVLVADSRNNRLRRITADGIITTIAGNGQGGNSGDGGPATQAQLGALTGVALDRAGAIYLTGGDQVRKITPDGIITRVAGGRPGFSGDGGPATSAGMSGIYGVAVDDTGNLYITESNNHRVRVVPAPPPSFQVAPASPTLAARSGGAAPPPATIEVTSSAIGLLFSLSVSTTSGGSWLRASPTSGSMPVAVDVTADPAGLAPGTYRGTITVTAPNAVPTTRSVTVTLTVQAAEVGRLSVEPAGLSFGFVRGAGAASRQLAVLSPGSSALAFTAAASERWLSVAPASGNTSAAAPASLTVTANPGSMEPGTYSAKVTVERIEVPVTMTITPVPQSILLSQTGLTFTAVEGGGAVPPQSFGVLNTGQGRMSWSVSVSTLSGGTGWLLATPGSGASDAASLTVPVVDVGVNPAGLAAGRYYGQVQVTAAGAVNSPQFVSVVLNVLPPGSNPGALVRPTGLIFTAVAGGTSPGSQNAAVSNLAAAPITFASNGLTFDGASWLVYVPTNATIPPNQPARMVVQPEVAGLPPGVRRGVVTLLFQDGSVRTVNVLLVLIAGGSSPRSLRVAQAGCRPARLLPVLTTLSPDFTVPAAWPSPVEARVVDDCGNAMVAGSVTATFSNGDPPLSLVSLRDGRWSGTWQARNARSPQVTVTVAAEAPEPRLSGATSVTGSLQANEEPPVVGSEAVVSAASFAAQAPVAPGSLVSIFGSRLAVGQGLATGLPLETQLAGTLALLGGRSLPLLYASDGQVNAVVPYELAVNTRHQLIVRRGSRQSVPEPVTVAAAQPAVFTKDQTGKGQGVIVDVAGRYVEAGSPARSGDAVVIYCSGLGEVAPPVTAGTAAPASPLSRAVNPVSVAIGGVRAEVLFAGLTPGFAGLYQVNAVVPAGVTAGNAVEVVVTVAGRASPPVTMAVR